MNTVAKSTSNEAPRSFTLRQSVVLRQFMLLFKDCDDLVKIRYSPGASPQFPTSAASTGRPPPPMASATTQSPPTVASDANQLICFFVAASGWLRTRVNISGRLRTRAEASGRMLLEEDRFEFRQQKEFKNKPLRCSASDGYGGRRN